MSEQLRHLPSIDRLLQHPALASARAAWSQELAADAARAAVEEARQAILAGASAPALEELAQQALSKLQQITQPSLRPVINATGVIIHTNLGRAPLSAAAQAAMVAAAQGYTNLEYDLGTGQRGSRYDHAVALLRRLTGAEDALVVNNNAGAVLLALAGVAAGREVIVSRGQLVEIGGGFRVPDVMAQSGARLVEVGTTNRTHLRDYEAAIGPETAGLLRVHRSNFRILGFTADVPLAEMVALAHERNLLVIDDLGSGSLLDTTIYGLAPEPRVQESVAAGADLITFSGDKLLGGPQAGIILGKPAWIEAIRKNPLTRALRIDKLTLAALEATLRLYRNPEAAVETIPTLRDITRAKEDLRPRAERLLQAIEGIADPALQATIVDVASQAGGGSLPLLDLPSLGVSLAISGRGPNEIEIAMRSQPIPIIGRIESDRFVLDVRTLCDAEIDLIADAVRRILKDFAASSP